MDDILRNIEKEKDRLQKVHKEKNQYLGEFKERVILALTQKEVEEKLIYQEVENALRAGIVHKMVISNSIDFTKLKKYILLAKKYDIVPKKIDSLSLEGDIGLVLCSKDKFCHNQNNRKIVVKSKLCRFREKGLPKIYFEAQGQKIDKYYYNIIKKELPELLNDYQELTFFDKIFGQKCPIYAKLQGAKK